MNKHPQFDLLCKKDPLFSDRINKYISLFCASLLLLVIIPHLVCAYLITSFWLVVDSVTIDGVSFAKTNKKLGQYVSSLLSISF